MSWEPINLASSKFAQPSEPPSLADLIYAGKRHVISGPPEAAKTLLAFIVALEYSRGGDGAPIPWVHVDFEMGETATRRLLEDLGASLDEIRAVLHYQPDGPPDLDDLDSMAEHGATLAIVDALAGAYDVSALDDNKRADVERFASTWIKPMWGQGMTTVTLDHVVKDRDNRGKYAIGSERKIGAADVHLGLEAITQLSRGTSGLVRITTHKDRPGHLPRPTAAELELRSDPDTHAITWEFRPPAGTSAGDTWRPTILMDRVLEHVGRYDYEPVARTNLAGTVHGKYAYVLQAIDLLLDEGRLALKNKRVVPVPGNVPGTFSEDEGNGTVPRSLSLQEERFSGTVFEGSEDVDVELPS